MKKPIYIYAIALVIAGLMISGATAGLTNPVSENNTTTKTIPAATMQVTTQMAENVVAQAQPVQAATLSEEQVRSWTYFYKDTPACAESHDGVVASAHRWQRDDPVPGYPVLDVVGWCGSAWDCVRDWFPYPPGNGMERLFNMWWSPNNNWSSILYWTDSNGCYNPEMDFRGYNGTTPAFVGTMVGIDNPPNQGNGWSSGDPFVCRSDAAYHNVREAYTGSSWGFSDNGWLGMKSADIDCDTTDDQIWRFGIQSLVISNDTGLQDGPALFFQFTADGMGTLSYFILSGGETTHCNIDEAAQMAYSVYDYMNFEVFQYQLFIRTDNWAEMKQYTGEPPNDDWTTSGVTWSFEDPVLGIREPAVAAANNNVLVVTELTNDSLPDDHDIICWYTDDGNTSNFEISVVAGSLGSEKHPEIEYVGGNSFVCAFYMDGKVYRSRTNDGGATWSEPVLVSGTDNVQDGHGCIMITNGGTKIFWSKTGTGNTRILNLARLETRVELSVDDIWDSATTCPRGDAMYNYVTVTVWDANGNPVAGIPAASFAFTVTPQGAGLPWIYPYTPQLQWFGTFGATFVAVDPVTDANGKIRFQFFATTSMKGDVLITATVNSQPINDVERLPCKSPDYDLSGRVDIGDFITFGQDWGKYKWRSDFTGNGGLVDIGDFITFGQHWSH
jgi:hypothetical protein